MTKKGVIITTSVLVAILMVFTILFGAVFRVREINIVHSNEFYYKTQINEILTTSKLKKNTSIFSIDRDNIVDNIETNYPYARVDGVNLSSFTSVKITLSNRAPLYYFVENEICYILDDDCKVLEKVTIQEYNAQNYQLIQLNAMFSASEDVAPGQFLNSKNSQILNDLYNALYSNAMIEADNGAGEFEAKYLDREDMCNVINNLKFEQEYELNGRVDKLVMTTSFGVKISIIEPQKDLDGKINRAFSALRVLQAKDRQDGTTLTQSGEINIDYSYDENNNATLVCEYKA